MCECECVCISCSVVSDSLQPHGLWSARLLCPWNSPGKNTGVGDHFLLQGTFLTQGLNQVSCIAGRFFTLWAKCWGIWLKFKLKFSYPFLTKNVGDDWPQRNCDFAGRNCLTDFILGLTSLVYSTKFLIQVHNYITVIQKVVLKYTFLWPQVLIPMAWDR